MCICLEEAVSKSKHWRIFIKTPSTHDCSYRGIPNEIRLSFGATFFWLRPQCKLDVMKAQSIAWHDGRENRSWIAPLSC